MSIPKPIERGRITLAVPGTEFVLQRFRCEYGRGPFRWYVTRGLHSLAVHLVLLHPMKAWRYLQGIYSD